MNPIDTTAPVQAVLTVTDNGTPITPDAVSWNTSDPGIATVNAAGVVTPVAPGSCFITGTASGSVTSGSVSNSYNVSARGVVNVTQVGDNVVATIDFQPIP